MLLRILLMLNWASGLLAGTNTSFIRRQGRQLFNGEDLFTFSGVNIYWLGADENNPDTPFSGKSFSHPSQFRIDDVLQSAVFMGSKVVRAHTLGISTGDGTWHAWWAGWAEGMIMPWPGQFSDWNFDSMDYAIFRAGQLGLRLVVPLTDEWNYYHGGIQDFLGPRGFGGVENVQDNCVCNIDQSAQNIFYSDWNVIGDFKLYIRHILDHVNAYTGIPYREDPTILAWETGNELYYPTLDWTLDIANFIKSELGASQLVMDGRMISRTGTYPEFSDPANIERYRSTVDIVSDHFYPMSIWKLDEMSTYTTEVLRMPYVIGEIGWTDTYDGTNVDQFMERIDQLASQGYVSGSLFWSLFGHAERFGHVTHEDGYSMYWPTGPEPGSFNYNNPAFREQMKRISDHMFRMAGQEIPSSYGLADLPPVFAELTCNPGYWIKIAFRGVAGAQLYRVDIDGNHMAFVEARQKEAIYIHNSVVVSGSAVKLTPLVYGDPQAEGVPAVAYCD